MTAALATTPPDQAPAKVTAATLIKDLGGLVKAIAALIKSADGDVMTLIKKLGIQVPVKAGAEALGKGITSFRGWLDSIKEPLDQTVALAGLIGLLQPLIVGVGRLATASLVELKQLGLGELDKAIGPAKTIVDVGGKVIGIGREFILGLPHSADITALQKDLDELVKQLAAFQRELARPLPPKPGGAN